MLLSTGMAPDTPDLLGNTPLFWAARFGSHKVAEMLLGIAKNSGNVELLNLFDSALFPLPESSQI